MNKARISNSRHLKHLERLTATLSNVTFGLRGCLDKEADKEHALALRDVADDLMGVVTAVERTVQ